MTFVKFRSDNQKTQQFNLIMKDARILLVNKKVDKSKSFSLKHLF